MTQEGKIPDKLIVELIDGDCAVYKFDKMIGDGPYAYTDYRDFVSPPKDLP